MGWTASYGGVLPPGLRLRDVRLDGDEVLIRAQVANISSCCPSCGTASTRLHSRYARRLSDLPAHGRRVRIVLTVRRFRCPSRTCRTRIFGERLDLVLMETRQVKAVLKAMPVKTDRRDAEGIAQLLRMGWFRPVHCKSVSAQELRALLGARRSVQKALLDIEQSLRGVLRNFGLKLGPVGRGQYEPRVRELVEGNDMLELDEYPGVKGGERIMARDPDRQTAEIHIRVALMNRFNALGTAELVRAA